jgi:putative CocE/NonD family hydrolase
MRLVEDFPRRVRVIETVWIEMPDGCRLAARIWLPEDAEQQPVPAILEHLPYRRRDFTRLRNDEMHRYFAGHGYACVRTDIRGSGDSDGILEDEYLQQELDDAVSVIAWLAKQPWCTGLVGMTGISWGGFNSLQVAALRPPALKAIITACSTDDRYADDIHYMGGCLISENADWATTMFGFNSRPPDPEVVGERWREMWLERLERNDPWVIPWTAEQRRGAVWKHGSVCEDYAAIDCAVYAVGGWADGYSNAIPRLMAGLSCPRKGLIGPWSHAWPNAARPGPAIGYLQEALRWWDQWLKGEDTGVMDEPMLRVWMQDSVPPAPQYETRPGRWVCEAAWPSPHIAERRLALNPGRLDETPEPEESLRHRSPQTLGSTGGEWCPYGFEAEMPTDQRLEDGQSLVFDSAALPERLEILGAPVLDLELAVDRPSAFLAVRLNDVAPDGSSLQVTYGLLNLAHRKSHEQITPPAPGERIRARVRLNDIAHAFPVGHRIRVAISTAYWPRVWPSPAPVSLTLFSGVSSLVLPSRAPRAEDEGLPDFAAPEAAAASPHGVKAPAYRSRVLTHVFSSGETVLEAVKNRGHVHLEDIDLTISAAGTERSSLIGDDPLSARDELRYSITMARGAWRVRTEARTLLSCTESEFLVSASLDAYEGDTRVFTKTWDRRIPRDGV